MQLSGPTWVWSWGRARRQSRRAAVPIAPADGPCIPPPNGSFRILSLDGGGIRGAYGAAFLAEIERRIRRPVADHFDLIAGTSTGGIIATVLAMGLPAASVEAFYLERGPEIFSRPCRGAPLWARMVAFLGRRFVPGLDAQWLTACKYRADALRSALEAAVGDRTLDAATRRLIVPAVNLARGEPVVFRTPHLPGSARHRNCRAVDVALATTAAPTYFPHAEIEPGSAYCDGGLWASNPAVVAYAEACRISAQCTRAGVDPVFEPKDTSILSIGTGQRCYFIAPPGDQAGLAFWWPRILEVMGACQSQGVDFQARHFFGESRYKRVDFRLHDKSWTSDKVSALPRLVEMGREAASRSLDELRATMLDGVRPPFTPFDDRQTSIQPARAGSTGLVQASTA